MARSSNAKRPLPIDLVEERVIAKCRAGGMNTDRLQMMGRIVATLREKCGVRTAADLGREDIPARFDTAIAEHSVSYRRALNITLRAFLGRAHKMGLIGALPDLPPISHHLPTERRSSQTEAADAERLARWLEDPARLPTWKEYRLYGLVSAVLLTGLPVGRLLRLRVEELELAAGKIRLPGKVYMGSRLPHDVEPIPPKLAGILAEVVRRTRCEWVFPNADRTAPWVEGSKEMPILARRALQRAAREAGIQRWSLMTFESLRRLHLDRPRIGARLESIAIDIPGGRPEPATSPGRSVVIGDREVIVSSDEQVRVIELLKREHRPLSLDEIGEKAGVKSPRHVMSKLRKHPVGGPAIMEETGASGRKVYWMVYTR